MRAKLIHKVKVKFKVSRNVVVDDVFQDALQSDYSEFTVFAQVNYGKWMDANLTPWGDSPRGYGRLVIESSDYEKAFQTVGGLKNGDLIVEIDGRAVDFMVYDVIPKATYETSTLYFVYFVDRSMEASIK